MLIEIIVSGLGLATAGWFVAAVFCGIEVREVIRRRNAMGIRISGLKDRKLLRIW